MASSVSPLERGETSYTSNLGLLSLRQEISSYVEKQFGMPFLPCFRRPIRFTGTVMTVLRKQVIGRWRGQTMKRRKWYRNWARE